MKFPKLGLHNYATWAPRITFLLKSRNLFKWIDTDAETSTDAQSIEDGKALALIGMSVEDLYLDKVSQCSTAQEAWDELKAIFDASSKSRVMTLMLELSSLKMGRETIVQYFFRALRLSTHLKSAGRVIEDSDLVLHILNGLPETYNIIRGIIINNYDDNTYTLDKVMASLVQEEHRFNQTVTSPDLALHTRVISSRHRPAFHRPRQRYPDTHPVNSVNSEEGTVTCWGCGQKGHVKRVCPLASVNAIAEKETIAL